MKSSFYSTSISLGLSLELAISTGFPILIRAEQIWQKQPTFNNRETLIAQRRSRLRFRVPNVRPTGNLEGGAARGNCSPDEKPISIMPLLPTTKSGNQVQLYSGSTIAARPNFFVHIPQTSAQEGKFYLRNQADKKKVYEATFALRGTPGIVKLSPPTNSPALEIGKSYDWSVQLICDPDDSAVNPIVKGVVQRIQIPPSLASIEKVAASDRPALYAQADIWYDTVSSLADLRYKNPNDSTLATDWRDLLTSVNLDTIADAPLIQCCTPKTQ